MKYLQVTELSQLPDLGRLAPFKAVIAVEDAVSEGRQQLISQWLVDAGGICLMVCGGDCEQWVPAIRRANLSRTDLQELTPEQFVMVTAHPREKLRQVFWHAKRYARHTHVETSQLVTIHIGRINRATEYQAMYQKV